jgi:hypothetical protein
VFTFHEDSLASATPNSTMEQTERTKQFQHQASILQRLIFSHFPVIEVRIRKIMRASTSAIRNSLRQAVQKAYETGQISKLFHGFTFNIRLGDNLLQNDTDMLRITKDFFKFIHRFFYSPRLERPLAMRAKQFPREKDKIFTEFLRGLFSFSISLRESAGRESSIIDGYVFKQFINTNQLDLYRLYLQRY